MENQKEPSDSCVEIAVSLPSEENDSNGPPENQDEEINSNPTEPVANEPDTIDLTMEDDDGDDDIEEIQEVDEVNYVELIGETDEDVQTLYNAPSEEVALAFDKFFESQNELETGTAQRIVDQEKAEEEGITKQQEQTDDDLIIEESVVKTDEEKRDLRKNKINDFLSWFIRLKPEKFTDFKTSGSNYLTEFVTDGPVINVGKCKEIAKEFKESNSLEGLAEKWELDNNELLIGAICIGVLEVSNDLDIEFNVLCDDRIDEWNFQKCSTFLDNTTSGLKAKNGPLKLMQFTATAPASAILALTIFWMSENEFPCRYRAESCQVENSPILQLDPFQLSNKIIDAAVKYWQEGKENGRVQDQMGRDLDEFFHEIEATSAEIKEHFGNTIGQPNEALELVNEKFPDFSDKDMENLKVLTSEQEQVLIKSRAAMESLKEELKIITNSANDVYQRKNDFEKMLVLKPKEFCLARAFESDDAELTLAITLNIVDNMTYRVRFLETNQIKDCNIRDLAIVNRGLYDPVFNTLGDVGLRVAMLHKIKTGDTTEKAVWLSGTTAGRRISHRGDFLVFLDNGNDSYLTAPTRPTDEGYEAATKKNEDNKLTYEEVVSKMNAAKIAVMVGQPLNVDGTLDSTLACHWVRQSHRSSFIRSFMKEFPEWPLLRMPIGMRIYLMNSQTDRRKHMVTVVAIDRAFAIVRHEVSASIAGYNCTSYPCRKNHMHHDERIYRGSHRLEGAAHKRDMLSTNNNLSKRRKGQLSSQFEPTDMERSMPTRNHQQIVKKKVVDSHAVVTSGQGGKSKKEIEDRKKKQVLFDIAVIPTPVLPILNELKPHPQCGPDCLRKMDMDPYDPKFYHNSPLHTPLLCGWRRNRYTLNSGKKRAPFKKVVAYFAPCGKPLSELGEVAEYLRDTRSMLTIDCFSFESYINSETYVTVSQKYVKDPDFSHGVEGIPIPLVNTVDDDEPPKLEYSKRRFQYNETVNMTSINRDFCSGCSCDGDCSDADKCECQKLSSEGMKRLPHHLQYDLKDRLVPHYKNRILYNKVITGLYECNDNCSCRKSCHNRVVQNNIKYPMQIFKTAESGWGCRALTDIPEGAFICNYVGALLTNDLAEELQNDDQYFADLDLKDAVEEAKLREDHDTDFGYGGEESEGDYEDEGNYNSGDDATDKSVFHRNGPNDPEGSRKSTRQHRKKEKEQKNDEGPSDGKDHKEQKEGVILNWEDYFEKSALYVVDAKVRGNLGRFLNHSCSPNVQVQHVMYDTHDLRLPWVAFFTLKHVKAGDELTWDYQYTQFNTETARLSCNCGATNCRRRLL